MVGRQLTKVAASAVKSKSRSCGIHQVEAAPIFWMLTSLLWSALLSLLLNGSENEQMTRTTSWKSTNATACLSPARTRPRVMTIPATTSPPCRSAGRVDATVAAETNAFRCACLQSRRNMHFSVWPASRGVTGQYRTVHYSAGCRLSRSPWSCHDVYCSAGGDISLG